MNRRIRQWAHDNAFTLIFLTTMFVVTWMVSVVVNFVLR